LLFEGLMTELKPVACATGRSAEWSGSVVQFYAGCTT
jgi:hypothetical protein